MLERERIEKMKRLKMAVLGIMFAVGMAGMAMAGSVDSPGVPGSAASKMVPIGDIYTYLTAGTPAPTPGTSFTNPTLGPGSTAHTLTEVYAAVATPFPQCDATVSDVSSGKKFFCAVAGSWGLQTGTVVLHQYCTLLKTGQTSAYRTGDDGSKNKGVAFSYTNSGSNLSVLDNVTGLMWAKDESGAGCSNSSSIVWSSAIDWAVGLTFDGYSDWRLPNVTELQSILVRDASQSAPCINKTYFINTVSSSYWAYTTLASDTTKASSVYFSGLVYTLGSSKTNTLCVRAVRGGE